MIDNSEEMQENIPLLDCPVDYLIGDASGKIMNEYGRFPCKIKCGVYALIVRGTASATININRMDFATNDVLLIEPGTFLLIHEFSEDALVYYILFSSAFLEKNATNTQVSPNSLRLSSPIIHLSEEQAGVLIDMAAVLNKASNCTPSMLNAERMIHVYHLLNTSYLQHVKNCEEQMMLRPQDRKSEIYQDFCNLVMKNYAKWHHVNQYAEAMRITVPHLCSTIKQVSDRTAGDIIIEAILTDAKAQLKISNVQIKEIALSLGFENVAFFNRFFKTNVGVTPKIYRMG